MSDGVPFAWFIKPIWVKLGCMVEKRLITNQPQSLLAANPKNPLFLNILFLVPHVPAPSDIEDTPQALSGGAPAPPNPPASWNFPVHDHAHWRY